MKTLIKKSKLTGRLIFVFLILFSIISILNYFNFRTLDITSRQQQQIAHSLKQILLLKQLESAIQGQLQKVFELIVQGDGDFQEFDVHTERVMAVFLEAKYFLKNNLEYESGVGSEELKILQELEEDYSKIILQLENLIRNPKDQIDPEKLTQINNLIEKRFDRKFQVFLSEATFEETKELETIKNRAMKNHDQEVILSWWLIMASLGFSAIAYRYLKSTTVSRNDLERINQTLQKEIIKKEKAESRTQDERQNLYNILESLPMAFHLQAPDYSVPFANKVFRERFGSSLEKPCYELMHNRSEPCEVCTTFKVFDHNKNETTVWDAQDGKSYLTVCTPFSDIDGSPLVMEMALDITDQENAKRQAELAMAEAEKANKAKSDFLARMSHELRTPLNSILGFSQLLLMDRKSILEPIQKENIDRILSGGQHLLGLINEVLDLSKIESGHTHLKIENISLRYLIQEIHELIEPMAAKANISLQSSLEGDRDIIALADRMRLKQVLLNLTSNALKYNKTNGEISIVCHQSQDGKIKISISDTGLGIDEKDLELIFEPFQRIESSSQGIEGTGIGLAISKQLINAMKGKIELESELGKGSSFHITLPTGDGRENASNPAQILEPIILKSGPKPSKDKKYKILYIEDNLANMELVGSALFRSDIKFLQSPDARLGIEIAKAHNPDLILMDINLPGMDGFEALKIIKENPHLGSTPIFALSANCMEADILKGLESGFDEYIPKPIRISDFVDRVNRVLR